MFKGQLSLTDTRWVRVWISTAAALCAALLLAPAALADTGTSANWSGYAVHHAGISFRKVSGTWKQATVSCTSGEPAYSAYWVGLGGYNPSSTALEQIGTEADCNQYGDPVFSAWYELVPSPSKTLTMTVRAGDTMSASVTVIGHKATLAISDVTRHERFSKTLTASQVDVSSAEWIVEAPSECYNMTTCETLPLADFGTATFTNAKAQGSKGHIASIAPAPWANTKIVLTPSGRRFVTYGGYGAAGGSATPSALSSRGSVFSVTFNPPSDPFMTVRSAPARVPAGRLYH